MELKKILIDKMEGNKSIQREDDDDQEGPSAGSNRGSKRRREGGEHASANTPSEPATESAGRSTTWTQSRQLSASESAFVEEPVQTTCQMEEPSHPPRKPPTPDHDWNKTLPAAQGNAQSWISALAKQTDARSSFNELLDTPIDFSNFIMNWLGVDTLTPKLLAGPTYELMRGSCNSLTELEYHLEEPLPLIPDNQGRRVIPFEHLINNDLEYLRGGASSQKYTTSVTKTMAADYGHIKWIEDLVPRTMWIQEPLNYDKHVLWGVSHWGRKRQQFYGFAVNREFALDVYSKKRIIAVTDLKIMEWHNYKYLDWISVVCTAGSDGVLADACSPPSLRLLDPRFDPAEGNLRAGLSVFAQPLGWPSTSLGIGVGGIGGWLAVVVVVMMDGVIVDLGEGIGVTVDEPVVKMDSIPGSIIGFNRLITNDDVNKLSC
nr:hypothetical protein [Tanacetum cinerariifolium]